MTRRLNQRATTPDPGVALMVVDEIPAIGAQPGDCILLRRESPRPVLLQRELSREFGPLQVALANGTARVIGDDSDPVTLAMLRPPTRPDRPPRRAPLRLIRGGAR